MKGIGLVRIGCRPFKYCGVDGASVNHAENPAQIFGSISNQCSAVLVVVVGRQIIEMYEQRVEL